MENILEGMFVVLDKHKVEITPELKSDLLVETRLVFKRIEGFLVDRVLNNATADFLSDYLPKEDEQN